MSAIKLTASQEREILRAENWPQDCSLTREGKLDIGREAIAFERKALREGYQAKTVEASPSASARWRRSSRAPTS